MNNKSDFLNHIDASAKSEVPGIHQIGMTPLDAVTHHWPLSDTWKISLS